MNVTELEERPIRSGRITCAIVAAAVASMACAAPAPTPTGSRTAPGSTSSAPPEPADAPDGLAEAAAMAPADATGLGFTDWSALRSARGVDGAEREIARKSMQRAPAEGYVIPATYAWEKAHVHAESWGWDMTDADWEARIEWAGEVVHVVAFPASFDLAPITARFRERGFSETVGGEATFYSTELDLAAEWFRGSGLAIRNTAVLTAARRLVLSTDQSAVTAVVDTIAGRRAAFLGEPPVAAVVGSMAGATAARVEPDGAARCLYFTPGWIWIGSASDEFFDTWVDAAPRTYGALGVGSRREGKLEIGLVALGYDSEDEAAADLEARRLLKDAPSLALWADAAALVEADAVERDGSAVLLRARLQGNRPEPLFRAVEGGDLLYASCVPPDFDASGYASAR